MNKSLIKEKDKSIFTYDGFTYYLTKTGKAKKQSTDFKVSSIDREEYTIMKKKYDWTFKD